MNNKNNTKQTKPSLHKQNGTAVLAMTMILLAVLTVIGITSSRTAVIETRMTTNSIEKSKSRIAAESTLNYALNQLDSFTGDDFLETCNRSGVYDLRTTASATCPDPDDADSTISANNLGVWNSISSAAHWNWSSTSLSSATENRLSATDSPILLDTAERTNPMKLVSAPQYAIGIHDAILRAGSENQYCFPVSIIAAAKGGMEQTQTLIEIKTIPSNGCFYP